VPTDHKDKFATIQSLGRTPFFTYGYTPTTETSDKPWQLSNRNRARILVQYAAKCRRENRNEAGWRYEVESKIFVRFDFEVAWYVIHEAITIYYLLSAIVNDAGKDYGGPR
jgi:hypothetical protein